MIARERSLVGTGAVVELDAGRPSPSRSSTPATGRSRSVRTTTSPRPTPRCSSTASPRAGTGWRSPRARRCASSPASIGRSTSSRSAGGGSSPGCAATSPGRSTDGSSIAERYARLYGPTAGDRIRLADTDLLIEVEVDHCVGGDEAVFGGGKVIRESMGQSAATPRRGHARPRDHRCGHPRPLGCREGRRRRA